MVTLALKSGETVSRSRDADGLRLNPCDVVIIGDCRGRKFPPTDEDIADMALDLFVNGQLQAIEARKTTVQGVKNTPVVTFGFTRTNAGRLLVEGFKVPEELGGRYLHPDSGKEIEAGEQVQQADFKLLTRIIDCNEEKAFFRNIHENQKRNETTDIDDAHNHQQLRDRFGKTDAEIARIYTYKNQNRVSRLKNLLQLDDEIQMLVHYGEMGTQAAIDLIDVDPKERAALIKKATKGGKVNGTALRGLVRDATLSDADTGDDLDLGGAAADLVGEDNKDAEGKDGKVPTKKGNRAARGKGGKTRTMAELRKYLDNRNGSESAEYDVPEYTAEYNKKLRAFADGKITDTQMDNAQVVVSNAAARDYIMDLWTTLHDTDGKAATTLKKLTKEVHGIEL